MNAIGGALVGLALVGGAAYLLLRKKETAPPATPPTPIPITGAGGMGGGPSCSAIVGKAGASALAVGTASGNPSLAAAGLATAAAPTAVCNVGEFAGKGALLVGKGVGKGASWAGSTIANAPIKIGSGTAGTIATIAYAPVTIPIKTTIKIAKVAGKALPWNW